ncbi:MAG: cupredoxin domain-containing protein, partial [Candidatus Nitrosotenuis sp.]
IAFSIGFTVALVAFAMSFSAMSDAPTKPMPVPTTPPPMEEETMMEEEEVVEETMEEETMMEEEEVVEEEEYEVVMSADVSAPSGSSTPGCEETDECFIPSTVEIGVGGTVTWTNDDTAAHTVTSGSIAADGPDGTFDSSIFMAGKTFEFTFDEAGEYDYFCVVHPWMTGKVIVE